MLQSIASQFGGNIKLPVFILRQIYQSLDKPLSDGLNDEGALLFDKCERKGAHSYIASLKETSVTVDDSREAVIIYHWVAPDQYTMYEWSMPRNKETISHTPKIYFYISDENKSLFFPSFKEEVHVNAETGEESVSYTEDGIATTPTEGWLEILSGSSLDGVLPFFEDKSAQEAITKLYSTEKIVDGISPDNLWQQEFMSTLRGKIGGKYLPLFNYKHFPTSNDQLKLRRSLVYSNNLKIVLKLSGKLFSDRQKNEPVYLLVHKPTEAYEGLGYMLFGDFTAVSNGSSLIDHIDYCVAFLKGDYTSVYGRKGMKILTVDKLKEPCLLDPSLYVK